MTWLMEFESTSFTGEKMKTPDYKPTIDACSCDEDGFGPCPHCRRKRGKTALGNQGFLKTRPMRRTQERKPGGGSVMQVHVYQDWQASVLRTLGTG